MYQQLCSNGLDNPTGQGLSRLRLYSWNCVSFAELGVLLNEEERRKTAARMLHMVYDG